VAYRLGIDPVTLTAMGRSFWPVVIADIDWPDDPVRVHSGLGTLTWNDTNWTGINRAGGLNLPGDGLGVQIGRGALTLGGSEEALAGFLNSAPEAQGRAVRVYFGVATDRAGAVLVGEPFQAWQGFMAESSESEDWDGSVARFEISVALEVGPPPRASATTMHNEAERRLADPEPVEAFKDTAFRHLRGVSTRAQNAVRS
jgi:hypothetical protein